MPLRVLILEDNEDDARLLERELRAGGMEISCQRIQDEAGFREAVRHKAWDVILADYSLPGFTGIEGLGILREHGLDIPFVLISGTIGEEVAVQCMKAGAHDYLLKDNLNRLVAVVEREVREAAERQQRRQAEQSLRESEQRRKLHFVQTPLAVIEWNLNFEVVAWNPAAERIFGHTAAQAMGKHASFILPASARAHVNEIWRELLSGRGGHRSTNENMTRDGRIVVCEWYNTPLVDERGSVIGAASQAEDVTDRKRAEDTLRSILKGTSWALGKEFFRSLVRELASALQMRYAVTSEVLPGGARARTLALCAGGSLADNVEYDLAGTPCEQVLGGSVCFYDRGIQKRFPKDDLLVRMQAQSYMGVALVDSANRPLGILAVLHDRPMQESELARNLLTVFAARAAAELERMRMEGTLRENEERFRLLIENSNEIVVELTAEGKYIYVSPNLKGILGYEREELVDTDAFRLMHPDDLPQALEQFRQQQGLATYRYRHKDGSWRWLDSTGRRFRTSSGEEHMVVVTRDITGRREVEESHRQLEAQLRHAQKLESLGTLAGGIAHDFNNVLTAIMGHTELARLDTRELPKVQYCLDNVLQATHRAKDLVQQILTFGRRQDQKRVILHVAPVVQEALKLLRSSLPATIEMEAQIEEGLTVLADATQLHQVLMNLCTNAAQSMSGPVGRIRVALNLLIVDERSRGRYRDLKPGRFARLSVQDTGCGMDAAVLERIFEPFFTTKPTGQGTGLGLAVVHGIVQNHDGVISVDSAPGQGSTFTIYLPLVEGEPAVELPAAQPVQHGRGEEIMIIDDEASILQIAERLLTRLGYRPVCFHLPQEALDAFEQQTKRFALVVTDLTMPRLTGVDVARYLLLVRPDIPIILATGYGGSINNEMAQQLGFRLLLSKPFQYASLAEAVHTVLQRR